MLLFLRELAFPFSVDGLDDAIVTGQESDEGVSVLRCGERRLRGNRGSAVSSYELAPFPRRRLLRSKVGSY